VARLYSAARLKAWGGQAVLRSPVEGLGRVVLSRIVAWGEKGLLPDHDLVLVEGEVDPAGQGVGHGVIGAGGGEKDSVVVSGGLDAQAAQDDAVAVAVVEQSRVVVERVRVAEGAAGIGVFPTGDGAVAARQPDLTIGRAGEDIPPVDGDALLRH